MSTSNIPVVEDIRTLLIEIYYAAHEWLRERKNDSPESVPTALSGSLKIQNMQYLANQSDQGVNTIKSFDHLISDIANCLKNNNHPRSTEDLGEWFNGMWQLTLGLTLQVYSPLLFLGRMIEQLLENAQEQSISPDKVYYGMASDIWPVMKHKNRASRCIHLAECLKVWMNSIGLPITSPELFPDGMPLAFSIDALTDESKISVCEDLGIDYAYFEELDLPFLVISRLPGVRTSEIEEIRRSFEAKE
jgi:hypothetical protein